MLQAVSHQLCHKCGHDICVSNLCWAAQDGGLDRHHLLIKSYLQSQDQAFQHSSHEEAYLLSCQKVFLDFARLGERQQARVACNTAISALPLDLAEACYLH